MESQSSGPEVESRLMLVCSTSSLVRKHSLLTAVTCTETEDVGMNQLADSKPQGFLQDVPLCVCSVLFCRAVLCLQGQ